MLDVFRVRGLRQLLICLAATLAPTAIMARQPMPFARLADTYGVIPSGPLLVAVPIVGIGWLWRDVANPMSTVGIRVVNERIQLWLGSLAWCLVSAACIAVRVYPSISPWTCLGMSLFFLGIAMILASALGALLGGTLTIAAALLGFLLAPVGSFGQWPYMSGHGLVVVISGSAVAAVGTALVMVSGFDSRRGPSRGRLIGINDV